MTSVEATKRIDYYRWNCAGEADCDIKCDSCNEALDMAIEALERCSKICDTCARWKPFADAMECTRDHCERGYDDYCSKWEDKNDD